MTDAVTELTFRERSARAEPEGLLILLHGRGADQHDLFPLFDMLDPERRLLGLSPRGPLSLPPGGAHWYVVRQVGRPDPETFWPSYRRLSGWLDAVSERTGIPPARTVLGGFSQGAVMSYAMALSNDRPRPAALLAFSGFIPEVEELTLDLLGRKALPVALAHGTSDPIIGVEFGRRARAALEEAGFDVLWRESPMGHSIDPRTVSEFSDWVNERIPTRA